MAMNSPASSRYPPLPPVTSVPQLNSLSSLAQPTPLSPHRRVLVVLCATPVVLSLIVLARFDSGSVHSVVAQMASGARPLHLAGVGMLALLALGMLGASVAVQNLSRGR
jgi:hypothetical protein